MTIFKCPKCLGGFIAEGDLMLHQRGCKAVLRDEAFDTRNPPAGAPFGPHGYACDVPNTERQREAARRLIRALDEAAATASTLALWMDGKEFEGTARHLRNYLRDLYQRHEDDGLIAAGAALRKLRKRQEEGK